MPSPWSTSSVLFQGKIQLQIYHGLWSESFTFGETIVAPHERIFYTLLKGLRLSLETYKKRETQLRSSTAKKERLQATDTNHIQLNKHLQLKQLFVRFFFLFSLPKIKHIKYGFKSYIFTTPRPLFYSCDCYTRCSQNKKTLWNHFKKICAKECDPSLLVLVCSPPAERSHSLLCHTKNCTV